jgi:hypothetical protein
MLAAFCRGVLSWFRFSRNRRYLSRPCLEILEDRYAPAGDINFWVATDATKNDWNVRSNWSLKHVPRVTETVVFDGKKSGLDCIVDNARPLSVEGLDIHSNYKGTVTIVEDTSLKVTGKYEQAGGTIGGLGTLFIDTPASQASTWTGGTMRGDSSTIIEGASRFNISAGDGSVTLLDKHLLYALSNRDGTPLVTWSSGTIHLNNNSRIQIDESSTFLIASTTSTVLNMDENKGSASFFSNTGNFIVSSTNRAKPNDKIVVNIDVFFLNYNLVYADSYTGTTQLNFLTSGLSVEKAGGPHPVFRASVGGEIDFKIIRPGNLFFFNDGTYLDGDDKGFYNDKGGVIKILGTVEIKGLVDCADVVFDRLDKTQASIANYGTLLVTRATTVNSMRPAASWNENIPNVRSRPSVDGARFDWEGGKFTSNNTLFIDPFAKLAIGKFSVAETNLFLVGGAIDNWGSIVQSGSLTLEGASIINEPEATYALYNGGYINEFTPPLTPYSVFQNKTGAIFTVFYSRTLRGPFRIASVAMIDVQFENAGEVHTPPGGARFPQLVVLPGGKTIVGRLDVDGYLDIQGGTVQGTSNSEIYGDIVNSDGSLDPSSPGSSGLLTIDGTNGTYTQTPGGTLNIDIGGTTVGADYDQLNITGQATLAGTLSLNLIDGFTPNIGDTFTIVTYGSHFGNFQTITGLRFALGKRFDIQYGTNGITLTVVADSGGSAPVVSGLSANTDTTEGGNPVTISGSNYVGVTGVFFGSTPAASYTVNSAGSITAIAPPGSIETVDVTVATVNGISSTSSADQYTYTAASAPTVTGLSTSQGSSGGEDFITISGTDFLGTTAVDFGSTAAPFFIVNSDTSITVLPPVESPGTVNVSVTTYSGTSSTSSADQYTYEGPPSVTGLSASTGTTAGGSPITITGTNFTDATGVYFGNVAATNYTVNSDTSITVVVPPQAAGTFDVTVANDSGISASNSADRFTYNAAAAPTVSGLSVTNGSSAGGDTVVLTGTGFTGATDVVFGNFDATDFIVNSDTQITAIDPSEAADTVDVTVDTFSGTSATSTADEFTYDAAPAPTVTGLSASSGDTSGGTIVTIRGTNFTGATGVSFGNVATDFTVLSDGSITATVPAEAAGTVDVTVTTYSGTSATSSADDYTYNAGAAPTVTGLSSSTGSSLGGDPVTILGTGFTSATGVSFGSVAADFTVNSDGSITAYAPTEAAGTVDVTVTTYNGTSAASTADHYTYTAASAPTVSALGTTLGSTAGGTLVTLTGTGFSSASEIDIGGASVFDFTVNSDSQITFETPAHAAGTWDVTVTNAVGTSTPTAADQFTYDLASTPSVSGLSSSGGSTAGGVPITISGSNFTGATAVNFGSVAADFTVNSDSSITATVPTQAVGTFDVTVTTYSGTSASSSSDHYTYTAAAAPAVTGLATTSGGTGGGAMATITGTGFTGATSVQFGSVQTTDFTVNSDTSITVFSPGHSSGTVHVTVTTYGGTSATSSADQFTYDTVTPSVTGLSPMSGSPSGGDTVTIIGTGFTGATGVSFGGVAATSFVVNSDASITATTPQELPGSVDVRVTAPGGTSATSSADQYTYNGSAPTVTGLSSTTGDDTGGYALTIYGTGFTGATAVGFEDYYGANFGTSTADFVVNSDTSLTVMMPELTDDPVIISVATPNGVSDFTPNAVFSPISTNSSAPIITGVSPTQGSTDGNQWVTITGSHFTGANGLVAGTGFGNAFEIISDTEVRAFLFFSDPGTYDIQLQGSKVPDNADGTSTGRCGCWFIPYKTYNRFYSASMCRDDALLQVCTGRPQPCPFH